ncbi:hypothetical protein [Cupriavidus numazuensis]|uniref:Uncharacterized protein n=1 Tax=Cupriavidus numazuensis TaxID=221992 RepID=A0ABN7Q7E1_9BURK|nr:hypothetical protein [Cupriavidus numazuensis]CAG2159122.1 hypothetical protein LMG26411_06457 [Cupriavidus numazuensis]
MGKDYELWNIDELLKAYANVPDMAISVQAAMEHLFLFLEKSALLTCTISDGHGVVTKSSILKSELTDEGRLLASGPKNPVDRWLGSKGPQKSPPDMRMLEKALTEIRGRY